MNWLTDLIAALRYYLQIKAASAQYDLTRRIETDIEQLEAERDRLRGAGDPDSQRRADILQDRILRAQGVYAAIPRPAAGPAAQGGGAGTNG